MSGLTYRVSVWHQRPSPTTAGPKHFTVTLTGVDGAEAMTEAVALVPKGNIIRAATVFSFDQLQMTD